MKKYILSALFIALSLGVYLGFDGKFTDYRMCVVLFFELVFLAVGINFLIPKRDTKKSEKADARFKKASILGILICIVLMPLTILFGVYFLGDRKYYFISLLLILEIMLPFFLAFEGRKPKTGEIVMISTLCVVAVLGRCAFYMLPQFKPMLAVVIISGAVFGGETGFLVGAISAFASNMFFGQGPWTPWQMLATGMVGLVAGIVFSSLKIRKSRLSLCIYGGLATVVVYGGIMNPASVIMYQPQVTTDAIVSFYISGLPFDLLNAESTVFFLWLIGMPMIEKLDRVRNKYGLI